MILLTLLISLYIMQLTFLTISLSDRTITSMRMFTKRLVPFYYIIDMFGTVQREVNDMTNNFNLLEVEDGQR